MSDAEPVVPHKMYIEQFAVQSLDIILGELYQSAELLFEISEKRNRTDDSAPWAILLSQAMQLLSSLRHSIGDGFLLTAGVLMRPIKERIGLIAFLHLNPTRISDWYGAWPGRSQPTFYDLMSALNQALSVETGRTKSSDLNSLVHGNYEITDLGANTIDGRRYGLSPHAMRARPDLANMFAGNAAIYCVELIDLGIQWFDGEEGVAEADESLDRCIALVKEILKRDKA